MRRHTSAVVVAVHDGWYGCGTGAGHSNRRLIEILDGIPDPAVDLVVLPVEVSAGSRHHDRDWHRALTDSLGTSRTVRVHPLANGTGGRSRFGGMPAFAALTRDTLLALEQVMGSYQRGLLLLLDVPFLETAARAPRRSGWESLVLPRSSAALHCPGNLGRTAWEASSLRAAAAAGVRIGAIAPFMRRHLTTDLGVPDACVVEVTNGLTSADHLFHPSRGAELLPEGVGEEGFVLALGRAVPRKGFEDLLEAWSLLTCAGANLPHLVLAAVSEAPMTAHQRELAALIRDRALDASLITRFSARARSLMAHPGVRALVVPSRVEPFGRIPLEAYAAGAAPVVATTAGGLADLVTNGVSGFTCPPSNPRSLADALRRSLLLSEPERERMRTAGRGILRAHDYRKTLSRMVQGLAPWALSQGRTVVDIGETRSGVRVLQVPELCGWNPYVQAAETALCEAGLHVIHPGLCVDSPAAPLFRIGGSVTGEADVVHLHWPEKLARQHGTRAALDLLHRMVTSGAVLVQTVHNTTPHEPDPELWGYLCEVDRLTHGAHFFSPDHERAVRAARPWLPSGTVHLPHPLFPDPRPVPPTRSGGLRMGCFGRVRGYKRTLDFAKVFLAAAPPGASLLVAGHPDSATADCALADLAGDDPRLDYRPGFVTDARFWELLGEVDWVALPYTHLYSSGVLVSALQAGRRILSSTPVGGTALYTAEPAPPWWITTDPFDHRTALTRWAETAPAVTTGPDRLRLPSWEQAATALTGFYTHLLTTAPTTTRPPARLGAA
ncbi:glycosyltransferase [Nocardiopsis exhalans]|uniref:Glycosyltransferase involved in cell wall biosynthesis n=3 Tax=Nocardiopsis TaxID=2013 RepID=A0A840W8S1_9ACTN|nr:MULTISPECIES: glycosyltransferase [Nocardiopsis]MBB5493409.1 glycosyltransferase involved in cell wall biosynthesis [Nocardiopsis metallicus]MCK9873026.1 glycosyltransferase [Nocardiopsis dassonvillei]MEE2051622.1 glycosyltransferase [Nocardiopsis umidischolae]USY19860.1 glycosyltransferase [Nocardiopsis exhalans]